MRRLQKGLQKGFLCGGALCAAVGVPHLLSAQTARPAAIPSATDSAASHDLAPDSAAPRAAASITHIPPRRWLPRHVAIGVGGVATSPPGRGTTYSPAVGGAFDVAAIGYLTARVAWRAEGFLHLHDRSVASEPVLLANDPPPPCTGSACDHEPRETARRTTGAALGLEYHPMRGRVGVYGLMTIGVAGTDSYGDAGRGIGAAPSAGIGLLAPLSAGLDGFAVEARWRRVPTVLGAVNAGVLSLVLRF